jgi:hypothetical protein
MVIYQLNQLLDSRGDEFLVLDYNHLFVADTIREEVWLLQHKDDDALLKVIMDAAKDFNIREANVDKDVDTYSGGQRAILACLVALAVIRAKNRRGTKLLLNNILNSISDDNREILCDKFAQGYADHDIRVFISTNGNTEEIKNELPGGKPRGVHE